MIRLKTILAGLALSTVFGVGQALADDAAPAQTPTPAATPAPAQPQLRALCTDRPTKSTAPCTVDAGHWQVESDIVNVTFDHSGGADTTSTLFTNPTVKYGLSNTVDIEVNLTPYETIVSRDRTTDITTHASGVGDLFARLKINLIGANGGDFAFALSPFIKAPTADKSIGNGAVEGGLIAPISFNLPANWSATVDPEIDDLKNAADNGRHTNTSALFSLSHPAGKEVTLSIELWGDENFDPKGTVRQASADLGAAWIPASLPNMQWDGGVNLGLNSATPAAQVYVGVSRRF